MTTRYEQELADVREAEALKRKRRRQKRPPVMPAIASPVLVSEGPVFERIRAVLSEESPIDLDAHAAYIASDISRLTKGSAA